MLLQSLFHIISPTRHTLFFEFEFELELELELEN
jgi:hypothetical protein